MLASKEAVPRPRPRLVTVLSDLHLGGDYDDPGADAPPGVDAPQGRTGFRMMTQASKLAALLRDWSKSPSGRTREVVINGDFVDFLAEPVPNTRAAGQPWSAFRGDPTAAADVLRILMEREPDAEVFNALRDLVKNGHFLTILLGNHDIELCLPEVRAALAHRLELADERALRFIHDGEAYVIGDALIEHGNRYDRFNQVSFSDLRALCSLQSRRQKFNWEDWFAPPPGSHLVTLVMNDLKRDYPFVDLLKPERETVIPLLLALQPESRDLIALALRQLAPGLVKFGVRPFKPAMPLFANEVCAEQGPVTPEDIVRKLLPPKRAEDFLQRVRPVSRQDTARTYLGNVSSREVSSGGGGSLLTEWKKQVRKAVRSFRAALGLYDLLTQPPESILADRKPALLDALRVLHADRSYDPGYEAKEYRDAASQLAREGGFKYVLFGHTHLAKDSVPLRGDALYFNSGTWCGLMQVPRAVTDGRQAEAMAALDEWLDALRDLRTDPKKGSRWIGHDLTYIEFAVREDGSVSRPQLIHHHRENLA